jgi:hypothetical protein
LSADATPTEGQARAALGDYIAAHLAITACETEAAKEVEEIKQACAKHCKPYEQTRDAAETILMQYAEGHPSLFEVARKVELYGGHKIGYHKTPPKVEFVRATGAKKKQTGEGFVAACKAAGKWAMSFFRVAEEPDKDAVLAAVRQTAEDPDAALLLKDRLASIGVKIAQEDRFVIDLNLSPDPEAV